MTRLLDVVGLNVSFALGTRELRPVRGVTFHIEAKEIEGRTPVVVTRLLEILSQMLLNCDTLHTIIKQVRRWIVGHCRLYT